MAKDEVGGVRLGGVEYVKESVEEWAQDFAKTWIEGTPIHRYKTIEKLSQAAHSVYHLTYETLEKDLRHSSQFLDVWEDDAKSVALERMQMTLGAHLGATAYLAATLALMEQAYRDQ
jgi:hypothetical protein